MCFGLIISTYEYINQRCIWSRHKGNDGIGYHPSECTPTGVGIVVDHFCGSNGSRHGGAGMGILKAVDVRWSEHKLESEQFNALCSF